ncbi:hypothetical protein [Cellulomonas wangsupingiae]|uniref:Uncharacterized protein n=1 Tax=Cellulomonas wangsupingiae TaxID=2968085 RepID=A0ABY5K311_9CELL|nr:hypothetical protein [Cellulomonas wangsupingiae]MCC2336400.1 hypothetical protein [Cellulomonas wangsupingiae]MCM0640909.1 hypothetical protein [Cellulomonas wangsupingiae]UUI64715.1 hypothetical protein NP075_16610 [Cellulomonas wangsupingiae]
MSQHGRTAGFPGTPQDDELAARITSALARRAATAPDPDDVAAAVEHALARRGAPRVVAMRRGGRIVAAGVVTGTLAVGAGSAAAAANPYSGVAVAVETAAKTVGLDVSFMPDGYTRAQYDAVEASGYTTDDFRALGELWQYEGTDIKARIGQAILDGEPLPIAPNSSAPGAQYDAYWGAGYVWEDIEALNEIWGTEWQETKLRAGQAILDGEPLPIPPSGTPRD